MTRMLNDRTVFSANLVVGQKMRFGYTVAAPYLHIEDCSVLQELVACFLADAQSLGHLVDVHYIGIILEHHSISISRREIQRFPFFPYGLLGCRTLIDHSNQPLHFAVFAMRPGRLPKKPGMLQAADGLSAS